MPAANYDEMVNYIRDAAIKRGINADVALEVARREALNVFDPSKPDLGGDDRSSFGIFQLHYGGRSKKMPNAGLGDEFTAKTGLKADDPSTWKQQVDFALDWAKTHGWGDWMGAKAAGITGMAGIDGKPVNFASTAGATGGGTAAAATNSTTQTAAAEPDTGPLLYNFPERALADDMAESVTPKVSRRESRASGPALPDDSGLVPTVDFASAIPETPPPEPVTTPAGLATDASYAPNSLADVFKIKEIGQAAAIDPLTGQPALPRPRRMMG